MIIYKAQNKINGKVYIGQSKHNADKRVRIHLRDCGSPVFYKALRKYSLEYFNISTIDCSDIVEEINEKEKYWIRFYNCKVPNGYNLTDGGDGIKGYVHTIEDREKMRKPKTSQHKRKLSEATKNQWQDPQMKIKLIESLKGKSPWNKGKKNCFTTETREKMSSKLKGRIAWNKGKKLSNMVGENNPSKRIEIREKIRRSLLKRNRGEINVVEHQTST